MSIVLAVVLCTVVGALGAVILVAASKFMAVEEDPRIEQVTGCLAGANCGGCGYAGCADYAKAIVMDGVPCDKCAPGGPKAAAAIGKIMGAEVSPQGGCRHRQDHGRRGVRRRQEGGGPVPGQQGQLQAQL